MNKISLIIVREYLSRVRKKSFLVMTFLGPILFAALMILPSYFASQAGEGKGGGSNSNLVNVVDETGLYANRMENSSSVTYNYPDTGIEEAKANFKESPGKTDALLYIAKTKSSRNAKAVLFYEDNQPSIVIQEKVKSEINQILEHTLIRSEIGVDPAKIEGLSPDVNLTTQDIKTGEKSFATLTTGLGFVGGILIYFFIFIFGSQVMRGVLEEKTSRIVEVIVSSVRPFKLMMGKIIGVALVGLTQFLLWIILTFVIITAVNLSNPALLDPAGDQSKQISEQSSIMPGNMQEETEEKKFDKESGFAAIAQGLQAINVPLMLLAFIFYFLFGYLLYGALFAAIGSAVDNEADTQQFMLPITIPLLIAIVMSTLMVQTPDGPIAFWFSIIPLTSPIAMMLRIPFGVPVWEVALSMGLLIITFLGAVWLAAKIYKTGILMYGKKINYKELWKWVKHSG